MYHMTYSYLLSKIIRIFNSYIRVGNDENIMLDSGVRFFQVKIDLHFLSVTHNWVGRKRSAR